MLIRIRDRLGEGARAVAVALPGAAYHVTAISAIGLIAYGAWLAYPPAGFIAGGVLLLAGLIMGSPSPPASR